jgi:hypothetical protein
VAQLGLPDRSPRADALRAASRGNPLRLDHRRPRGFAASAHAVTALTSVAVHLISRDTVVQAWRSMDHVQAALQASPEPINTRQLADEGRAGEAVL